MNRSKHRNKKNKKRKTNLARLPIVNTISQQANPQAVPNQGANAQRPAKQPRPPSTVGEIFMVIFVGATVLIYIFLCCIAIQTLHIDQRAWLNVTTRAMDRETINANFPINGRALLSNTGKTAAKQIFSEFQIEFLQNSEAPSLRYDKSTIKHLIGYMSPTSDPISINVFRGDKMPTETLSEQQAKDLIEGRAYLAIFGHGQYWDIFGEEHWFHFCGYNAYLQTPKGQNALTCVEYTNAGDGSLPEGRLTK